MAVVVLRNRAGLAFELFAHGAPARMMAGDLLLNLFPGNVLEGGPANLWLRMRQGGGAWQATPLLGPRSPLQASFGTLTLTMSGQWQGLQLSLQLRLAEESTSWFWHLDAVNHGSDEVELSLVMTQDVGLANPQAVAINEFYVSQYIDWQPLEHARHGTLLAARQNQAQDGRYPWLLMGSLRRAGSYATDGLQFFGLAGREGAAPPALATGLPGTRLQHEHALAALEDEPLRLAAGTSGSTGFFAHFVPDHAAASGKPDIAFADAALRLPEAADPAPSSGASQAHPPSLFAGAAMLRTLDLDKAQLGVLFGAERKHAEQDGQGQLLSFFQGDSRHVVLRAKELRVKRAHGHMLRAGSHLTPDERALTSTCWMGGCFHSMLTQGHVKFGRLLSNQRSGLSLFNAQGLRAFVRLPGQDWMLLGLPSAFVMEPGGCRWIYAYGLGVLEVQSSAGPVATCMEFSLKVLEGPRLELMLTLHAQIDDDDAGTGKALTPQADGNGWLLKAPADSTLAQRLTGAALRVTPDIAAAEAGDDALLHADHLGRDSSMFCLRFAPLSALTVVLQGVNQATDVDTAPDSTPLSLPRLELPAEASLGQLESMLPWLAHNALVHYLAPRGPEQFSGGGWGVRDVCQGPLELLLALGRDEPVRDLLVRVFSAQNADGDWPQWFMFFARDAKIRAGDSHGDVVFWPLLGLARYLIHSGDAALLNEPLPYFDAPAEPLIRHVERALTLIESRMIPGRGIVAYGHGDWNDALQPADPSLRDDLCSAWTVTLHHQTLHSLAEAFDKTGGDGQKLRAQAHAVQEAFQRELVRDEVVAGYAHCPPGAEPSLWIHPSAPTEGLSYSLLPMMHAVLEDLLTPAQAAKQSALIKQHLHAPDGARLFDAPLPYHGGISTRFLRAETSSFFGREIGIMYMHAHLRHAQMLAHLGDAPAFFEALGLANPILLPERVAAASLRQSNCYYSSSDAAYADRYAAHAEYGRVFDGSVALDGGWRIYSSGPGIALSLVINHLLGLRLEHDALLIDPVMPVSLAGLRAEVPLGDFTLELRYDPGAQGSGVTVIEDDKGHALPFTRRGNPYRLGAAAIARPQAGQRLRLTVRTQ
ncbi:MAG TPA: hypothetical protein VGM81_12755 [Burkholderiaceae bacterium]|jgi:cellobiose phosphorylase